MVVFDLVYPTFYFNRVALLLNCIVFEKQSVIKSLGVCHGGHTQQLAKFVYGCEKILFDARERGWQVPSFARSVCGEATKASTVHNLSK